MIKKLSIKTFISFEVYKNSIFSVYFNTYEKKWNTYSIISKSSDHEDFKKSTSGK